MVSISVDINFRIIQNLCLFLILINSTNQRLIAVFQLIRHDARAPIDYTGDVSEKFTPFKNGELTNIGHAMALAKGGLMREFLDQIDNNYINYLENHPEEIQLLTTPFQRTIFTSQKYLKGLFPSFITRYIGINDPYFNNLLVEENV